MPERLDYVPPEAIDPISPEDQKAAKESLPAFREEKRQTILENNRIDHDPEIHRDQADKSDKRLATRHASITEKAKRGIRETAAAMMKNWKKALKENKNIPLPQDGDSELKE